MVPHDASQARQHPAHPFPHAAETNQWNFFRTNVFRAYLKAYLRSLPGSSHLCMVRCRHTGSLYSNHSHHQYTPDVHIFACVQKTGLRFMPARCHLAGGVKQWANRRNALQRRAAHLV